LCRAVIEELGERYSTALILNPVMTGIQLLRSILGELGLNDRGNDRLRLLERLNTFLLEQLAAGIDVVVFVDEAQDLSPELLEQVRLLSNLETEDRKLVQIVLIGQPELKKKLDRPELRQLRQRITVRYHLGPLDRRETEAYVRHRLQVAGSNGRPSFSRWGMARIHRYSRGVPRVINAVCDTALLAGYVEGVDHIGRREVGRAIRELEGRTR